MTEAAALVIGEALIDEVRRADGTVTRHPGGSPANIAVGLGRLERPVWLWCSLGSDDAGAQVSAHVEASGARIVPAQAAPRTSVATATLNAGGAATYTFDLAWELGDAQLPADIDVVHTGSIAAVIEPGATVVEQTLRSLRDSATITYDPNARPALMGSPSETASRVERIVALADVVKASSEDLEWLYDGVTLEDAAATWLDAGPAVVVVTLGADGCFAMCRAGTVRVSPVSVTVADTVGAGDSFMSALIDGLWSRGLLGARHRDALHRIGLDELREVLERSAQCSAITVSRAGANPPTLAELEAALAK